MLSNPPWAVAEVPGAGGGRGVGHRRQAVAGNPRGATARNASGGSLRPSAGYFGGQQAVRAKRNELDAVPGLLEQLELRGRVVTAAAQFTQRRVCQHIVSQGHYFFAIKDNQPALRQDIAGIWSDIREDETPLQAVQTDRHGSRVAGYSNWPHLAQVCRLERITHRKGETRRETSYAVTSLTP